MKEKKQQKEKGFSRREFLKIGGTVAGGVQIGAVAGVALAVGKDPQFIDRKSMEIF